MLKLNDDCLRFLVFNYLCFEDQVMLGLTCQRLRALIKDERRNLKELTVSPKLFWYLGRHENIFYEFLSPLSSSVRTLNLVNVSYREIYLLHKMSFPKVVLLNLSIRGTFIDEYGEYFAIFMQKLSRKLRKMILDFDYHENSLLLQNSTFPKITKVDVSYVGNNTANDVMKQLMIKIFPKIRMERYSTHSEQSGYLKRFLLFCSDMTNIVIFLYKRLFWE